MKKIKPFLRWAGGKSWLTKYIEDYLPTDFENYYEPFIGGGSIFLHLKSKGFITKKAYLSDSNADLINTYKIIKKSPEELIRLLEKFNNSEEEYYRIRSINFDNKVENAAKFIFLNKTSFNGIYRVNRKGQYNVPYGFRKTKDLFEFDNLLKISDLFDKTYFSIKDFSKSFDKAQTQDLFFIDPPYTVAHENNGFVQYNQSIFSWKNQIQLSNKLIAIDEKNINFIVTNAKHDSIDNLYQIGNKHILSRASTIGGNGAERTNYNEFLITNVTK